jgi:NitT/TauT family transport system ATP-binding protein
MDEPFGSLDAQTREDLEDLLLEVHRTDGATIVFVTHDIDESVYVGDRVVVLSPGPASHITLDLPVHLPADRNQITTRGLPDFVTLRAQVGRAVRDPEPEPPAHPEVPAHPEPRTHPEHRP